MQFFAHHGCFAAERVVGTRFSVDLSFSTDTSKSELSDDISDTISYLDVYQVVKKEMETPSNLLEHVARRIRERIASRFPKALHIRVEVRKLNPALGGEVGYSAVLLEE